MEKCWKELDKDNAGVINLKHFAEEEYALVEGLKAAMIAKSGSIVRCWVEQFDREKAGICSKDKFEEVCASIGYEHGPKVFLLYDIDRSNTISLEEIDQESEKARLRGDVAMGLDIASPKKDQKDMSFEERQMTDAQRRKAAEGKALRDEQKKRQEAEKAADVVAKTPEDFKREIGRKYG